MYTLLAQLADAEALYLEPSALAGMYGPVLTQPGQLLGAYTKTALPAGALETAPDIWAEAVKQADHTQAAAEVRAERDRLISACDWTVLDDAKTDKQAWTTYRQALRDVPEQPGFPYDVAWPAAPEQL